ncbi:hypothetical protein [Pseudomonas phage vB_PaeM_PAO1_Ab17]|uniref:Uncharacterized protein n=2 Tax=Nankokuvirus Ab03 TaxID=1925780 RepID=A0A0A1IUH6_9CAUD|nr:hypothetical protein VC54_gp054 [Pseudomonas phage vB_PaeM_PAO1_Ab03]CEF89159.1 hypothetical protein [Pseudomonas phage vB_PaeM_PAO1_Ab03]CEF89543.1 hypothetical protein [Pseudomonas phage vB_PaeM_PAO1_Ab17]
MRNMFVTPHARKRFRERFRLQFHPSVFEDGRDIYVIRKLFAESKYCDFELRMRVGNYNALCVKHGRVVRVSKVRNFVFVHDDSTIYTILKEGMVLSNVRF